MERVYTIPLRNVKKVKRTIRAPRAIREVQNFLFKHMKAEEVKIDESINHVIWARGIQKIPSKITVKAVKDDDGVVKFCRHFLRCRKSRVSRHQCRTYHLREKTCRSRLSRSHPCIRWRSCSCRSR